MYSNKRREAKSQLICLSNREKPFERTEIRPRVRNFPSSIPIYGGKSIFIQRYYNIGRRSNKQKTMPKNRK